MSDSLEPFVVCWKHKPTGEEGHGAAVPKVIADEYMARNPSTLPEFEFHLRPALPEELGPKTKVATPKVS